MWGWILGGLFARQTGKALDEVGNAVCDAATAQRDAAADLIPIMATRIVAETPDDELATYGLNRQALMAKLNGGSGMASLKADLARLIDSLPEAGFAAEGLSKRDLLRQLGR